MKQNAFFTYSVYKNNFLKITEITVKKSLNYYRQNDFLFSNKK